MSFSGPLEDRVAIAELNAGFGDHISAREPEQWGALWADDARWDHPRLGQLSGKAAIIKACAGAFENLPFIFFVGRLGAVDVRGDAATGRVWVIEFTANKAGDSQRVCGLYTDDYVKRQGVWLFQHRRYRYLERVRQEPIPAL